MEASGLRLPPVPCARAILERLHLRLRELANAQFFDLGTVP